MRIKVIGIGGSGGNIVSRMKKEKIEGVEFIVINTDYQDLKKTQADFKLRIGRNITQGLGTGMNPEIGEKAALEQRGEIEEFLKETDLIFLTYGAGGGTGSGAGPVVAEIAKNLGILTIAIVTLPFSFEGKTRLEIAKASLKKLKGRVDALISISNDKLLEILPAKISLAEAFWFADQILREGVRGISDLLSTDGLINIDFANIKAILKNSGSAIFGLGKGKGEKRAQMAAKDALYSPLLEISPKGARGILFYVRGDKTLSFLEVEEIGKIFRQEINPEAKIIFGACQDEKIKNSEIKVNLIATGF